MLQRIQSLWLLLAATCAGFTLKYSFFSGNILGDTPATAQAKTFTHLTGTYNFGNLAITIILAAVTLANIFNYKKRNIQFGFTISLIILSLLNILQYYHETQKFIEGNYDLTALLSIAVPILLFMAARGIRKDQKLVKSLDRLR